MIRWEIKLVMRTKQKYDRLLRIGNFGTNIKKRPKIPKKKAEK